VSQPVNAHIRDLIRARLEESARVQRAVADQAADDIAAAARTIVDAFRSGHKLLLCGNGGSAADAQHVAGELVGRYLQERRPLPAIALTADSAMLTAIGNDYGFDRVFARQVEALARPGDVLMAISTSGSSPDVLAAVEAARKLGAKTIGLTGETGGKLTALVDLCFRVPSAETPRIQEAHIAVAHVICELVEAELVAGQV